MNRIVIDALMQPEAYPDPIRHVDLLQTHVSLIFITDDFVYKVKKPVDFGFLNFSTIDRRRFYCEEEVRLNRRLCPNIYLGVVEVRTAPSGAAFTGDGEIIDYAVKMKRLPEKRMLHRLIADRSVTDGDMRRIARKIGNFHKNAERSSEIAEYGTLAAIRRNWDENFSQITPYIGISVTEAQFRVLRQWTEQYMSDHHARFQARIDGGFIRDCDGDIHLENICITDDVCIFDCIEFNNRFRYCDTAADLAFLLMDLEYNGRPDLSRVALEEYLAVTADSGIVALLEFYKTYRAVVRGKVESFRLNDDMMPPQEKETALKTARRFLRLAMGYCIRDRFPFSLILLCGVMGTGKSSIASALSLMTGLETVSSDRVRKELAGLPPTSRSSGEYGTGIYDAGGDRATYRALHERAGVALAAGRSIIVDASFRKKGDRQEFRRLAEKFGARMVIVCTRCPEELVKERLELRSTDPTEVSDGRWELYHHQLADFESPGADEEGLIFIDTSQEMDHNIESILYDLDLT